MLLCYVMLCYAICPNTTLYLPHNVVGDLWHPQGLELQLLIYFSAFILLLLPTPDMQSLTLCSYAYQEPGFQ